MNTERPSRAHALSHFMTLLLPCITAAAVSLSGCGAAKKPWEVVHPAKGSVNFKGKPVKGAEIVLIPEETTFPDTIRPRATTGEDGTFTLWTYQHDDGVPVGTYKATIVHNEVFVKGGAVVVKPNDLPKKYARPETTDLVIQIASGGTELPPFELK